MKDVKDVKEATARLDEVRTKLESRGIDKIKLGGFDVDGVLRGKYVSRDKFLSAAQKGMGFCDVIFGWDIGDRLYDNATVTGWHTGYPDILARVDLDTMRFIPWEPDTAAFVVDFYTPAGEPHPACPRNTLKRVLDRLAKAGYRAKVAAEYEYFFFRETPQSLRQKNFRGLDPLTPGMFGYSWLRSGTQSALVHEILDSLKAFDIEIESMHTETGPGVYESAIAYDDALRAADKAGLFKNAVKQVAARHGLVVTFMAKWNAELPGSSGHLHESLWDEAGQTNLFADPKAPDGLSAPMRRFIGGQIALLPELTALVSPTINSYKRFVPGVWAPLNASWGIENRTTALRAIAGPSSTATRVEVRLGAADMNPYVAIAATLGAGLWGIEHEVDPPPPWMGDALADQGRHPRLPASLAEAVAKLRASEAARQILGEPFVEHYLRTRDWEVREYQKAVTHWELERYFEAI